MVARTDIRPQEQVASVDPIWDTLRSEAALAAERDPLLAAFIYSTVLNHRTLEDCVIHRICERLDHADVKAVLLRQTFDEMLQDWPSGGLSSGSMCKLLRPRPSLPALSGAGALF